MRQIEEVIEIMKRHPGVWCAECDGSGWVKPSPLFHSICLVANGRAPKRVMCLKCQGTGVS